MPALKRQPWSGIIERLLRPRHRAGPAARNGGDDAALPEPRVLGLRMAALYCCWQRSDGPDLQQLTGALVEHIGLGANTPVACTCRNAAGAVSRWRGRAYHSARHHAEVATNAIVLAAIAARRGSAMPPRDLGILLAAAVAHDIHWEPALEHVRFAMEAKSAATLDAIAAECGVGAEDRHAMRALVLATEPRSRADLAAPAPPAPAGNLPEPLAWLLREPRLVRLAALLSDADLLSSAGLSLAWTRVQGQRLARETRSTLGEAERKFFFDSIVGPRFLSPGGDYFAGNLARIRAWRPSGRGQDVVTPDG
jgi:hypothetical protein